jgi:hypothetical protein
VELDATAQERGNVNLGSMRARERRTEKVLVKCGECQAKALDMERLLDSAEDWGPRYFLTSALHFDFNHFTVESHIVSDDKRRGFYERLDVCGVSSEGQRLANKVVRNCRNFRNFRRNFNGRFDEDIKLSLDLSGFQIGDTAVKLNDMWLAIQADGPVRYQAGCFRIKDQSPHLHCSFQR